MKPLLGITVRNRVVLRMLRSLYGLKQAARDQNKLCKASLVKWGFIQSLADPCLFINDKKKINLLVYVDDIFVATREKTTVQQFAKKLSSRFNTKSLGEISKVLGARITRDRQNQTLYLDQEQYLNMVLEKFGITHEKYKPKVVLLANYEAIRLSTELNKAINDTDYQ